MVWAPWVDPGSSFDNFTVSGAAPVAPVATTVTVTPGTATMTVGGAPTTLTAAVLDQSSQPMANATVTWSVAPSGIVSLAPNGLTVAVTPLAAGTATVTATSGSLTRTATMTVVAAGTNQVFDSFTAANGTVAGRSPETNAANSQWQIFGPASVAIQSNTLHAGTGATVSGAVVNAGIANATVSADWTVGSGTVWGGVVIRFQDAANFVVARYYMGKVGVFRYVAGTWVADGDEVPVSAAAGSTHNLAVTTSAATITVRWDNVVTIQTSDTFQQTRTVHGVIWAPWVDSGSSFDNFTVK